MLAAPRANGGEGAAARHGTGHGHGAALGHSATSTRGTAIEESRAIASRGTARERSLRVTRKSQALGQGVVNK